jgi:hypothetical protein
MNIPETKGGNISRREFLTKVLKWSGIFGGLGVVGALKAEMVKNNWKKIIEFFDHIISKLDQKDSEIKNNSKDLAEIDGIGEILDQVQSKFPENKQISDKAEKIRGLIEKLNNS